MKVDVASGPAKAAYERGQALSTRKVGALNFSCADCHSPDRAANKWIRGQRLGELKGQLDHFPTWRTSQQSIWDIHNVTSITFPQVCRTSMSGARLKEILEEVADNLVHPDPYYRQGGDMIRCGGIGYTIDIGKPAGQRISDMTAIKTGQPIEAGKEYTAASWACGQQGQEGPPAWEILEKYIARPTAPRTIANSSVKVLADNKSD